MKDGTEVTKPKKDTILYLEENHELPKMENGFEDETTKEFLILNHQFLMLTMLKLVRYK